LYLLKNSGAGKQRKITIANFIDIV
jgi:hypothetical protein